MDGFTYSVSMSGSIRTLKRNEQDISKIGTGQANDVRLMDWSKESVQSIASRLLVIRYSMHVT
jgi:hypothetical protein